MRFHFISSIIVGGEDEHYHSSLNEEIDSEPHPQNLIRNSKYISGHTKHLPFKRADANPQALFGSGREIQAAINRAPGIIGSLVSKSGKINAKFKHIK